MGGIASAIRMMARIAAAIAMLRFSFGQDLFLRKNLVPCADEASNCRVWAEQGECTKNPSYMDLNCKKSCGLCPSPPPAPTPNGCMIYKDKSDNCNTCGACKNAGARPGV